jgi:hypothetical protein
MSPTLNTIRATLRNTASSLQSAIVTAQANLTQAAAASDATTKANAAYTNAQTYASGLTTQLAGQVDHVIVYWYNADASDPSSAWTTDALKTAHNNDYWRKATELTWWRYARTGVNTGAWTQITDTPTLTQLQAAASASSAQTTANGKNTLFASYALAQSSAVAGDMFIDSANTLNKGAVILYQCLTALAATYNRLTPKRYADVASSSALAALTGMIPNDTVYETDTLQWYYYSGSAWVADGSAQNTVVATYNPIYRGIGVISSTPTASFLSASVDSSGTVTTGLHITPNTNDWMVNYSGSVSLGIYYWSGSAWTVTTDYKYIADAAIDLCYLSVGGVTISGFTTFMTAIIKTLFVQTLTLLSGGTIASSNYVSGTSGFKLTGSTGTIEMINAVISGTLGSSGLFGGHIKILLDRIYIFSGSSFDTPAVGDILLTLQTYNGTNATLGFSPCLASGVWSSEGSNVLAGDGLITLSMQSGAYTGNISFDCQGNAKYTHPNDAHSTWVYGYPLAPASVVGSNTNATNCIGEVFSGSNIGSSGSPPTQASITLPNRGTWFAWGESFSFSAAAFATSFSGFYAGNSSISNSGCEIVLHAIRIA